MSFRFHDLRHWFAVDYQRRGGNIYTLQKILGHGMNKRSTRGHKKGHRYNGKFPVTIAEGWPSG